MFKTTFLRTYLIFGLLAGLIYCIPVYFFIQRANYTQTWLLYLGNFLFMVIIIVFLIFISRLKNENSGTLSLIVTGEKEVILGTIIASILAFVLLAILIRGLFGNGIPGKVLSDRPVSIIHDRTHGLDFMVLTNAVIGNFVTGSFISVILPASLGRYQRK